MWLETSSTFSERLSDSIRNQLPITAVVTEVLDPTDEGEPQYHVEGLDFPLLESDLAIPQFDIRVRGRILAAQSASAQGSASSSSSGARPFWLPPMGQAPRAPYL